jgi:hypothetical protein
MNRVLLALAVLVVAVLGCLAVFRSRLPYSFEDVREKQAAFLYSALQRWRVEGGELKDHVGSGNHLKVVFTRTNFVCSGHPYSADVIWNHYSLGQKGVLVGSTNARVFWIGNDGTIILLKGDALKNGER